MDEGRGVEFNLICVKIARGWTDRVAYEGGTEDKRKKERKTSAHMLISRREWVGVAVPRRGGRRGKGRWKEIAHTLMIKVHKEAKATLTALHNTAT